jgi:Transcription factor WhiB
MPAGLRTPAYLSCSRAARNPSEQVGNRATCRDQDPERFFPEPGEQTKAAEAKAIRAGWQVPNHCRDLAVKADGGIDADHGVFGGCLPVERSRLRGTTFPESSAYRQRRELAEQAHQLAGQVGLRQAARQLGIHRDALKAAFAHWGLPALELRVGWQPSRFFTDRAEAECVFRLAEWLGSVRDGRNAPVGWAVLFEG